MHHEALTKEGKRLFPRLNRFTDFYLAGGTALALQIGHRVSVDFDLFSAKPLEKSLLPKIKRIFADELAAVLVNNPGELTLTVAGVKCTFLNYPFPILEPLVTVNELSLLSPAEIAATKAYSVGRRGEYKDYIDLYFLLNGKYTSLDKIIDLANRKYGAEFNDRLFLEQLLYLDDVEEMEIVMIERPLPSKKELLDFFL